MSAFETRPSVRPLELRRGTKAVTELLADGRRSDGPLDGRPDSEKQLWSARERRYRWQSDVSGP